MKNHLSNLSMVLIGFIGGIAFLISCGGGGDGTTAYAPGLPINDADAGALPVINDQMYCYGIVNTTDETYAGTALTCMKQSTKVQERYTSLAGVYAEGWIMVEMTYNGNAQYLFYK